MAGDHSASWVPGPSHWGTGIRLAAVLRGGACTQCALALGFPGTGYRHRLLMRLGVGCQSPGSPGTSVSQSAGARSASQTTRRPCIRGEPQSSWVPGGTATVVCRRAGPRHIPRPMHPCPASPWNRVQAPSPDETRSRMPVPRFTRHLSHKALRSGDALWGPLMGEQADAGIRSSSAGSPPCSPRPGRRRLPPAPWCHPPVPPWESGRPPGHESACGTPVSPRWAPGAGTA